MRSSAQRKKKYAAKTDGVLSNKQIAEYRRGFAGAVPGQQHIELGVKTILAQNAVYPGLNHFYMVFGKELGKLMKTHSEGTMMVEMEGLQIKWAGRGLDTGIMDLIKEWFGLVPLPRYCLFDVGLYDVCLFG